MTQPTEGNVKEFSNTGRCVMSSTYCCVASWGTSGVVGPIALAIGGSCCPCPTTAILVSSVGLGCSNLGICGSLVYLFEASRAIPATGEKLWNPDACPDFMTRHKNQYEMIVEY